MSLVMDGRSARLYSLHLKESKLLPKLKCKMAAHVEFLLLLLLLLLFFFFFGVTKCVN